MILDINESYPPETIDNRDAMHDQSNYHPNIILKNVFALFRLISSK
jgi:hypothetical protein